MSLKDYHKPNWYPSEDVVATKSGWVNSKNSNEVLVAISNLDKKLSKLDDETTMPNPPSITFLNSLNVKVSGLASAPLTLKVGNAVAVAQTADGSGNYTYVLSNDIVAGTLLKATQEDPDENVSPEASFTVTNKLLKGSISVSTSSADSNGLDAVVTLTNVANGSNVKLYIGDTLASTVTVSATAGAKTATFSNVSVGDATSVKFTVKATDLSGKEIVSAVKTQAVTA